MNKLLAGLLCICSLFICCTTAFAATALLSEEIIDVLESKWPDWTIPVVTYQTTDHKYVAENNTPASYYYDEHGYAAAFAVLTKNGKNRLVILEKKGDSWKVIAHSTDAVRQGDWIPSISCEMYGKLDIYYSYRPYMEPIYYAIERESNGYWYLTCIMIENGGETLYFYIIG